MNLTFRLARQADIDILVNFIRQFYAIDNYPFEEQTTRQVLGDLVNNPALGRVWLIERDNKAIGYIVVTFGYSLEFHGRDAFIDELFVEASQRHQGVGALALQFVLEACPELGIQALHLEVERTNLAGQQLYRKFGFKGHDRYLMTRWIML